MPRETYAARLLRTHFSDRARRNCISRGAVMALRASRFSAYLRGCTEGTGFEPVRAFARRFSRPVPYHSASPPGQTSNLVSIPTGRNRRLRVTVNLKSVRNDRLPGRVGQLTTRRPVVEP